jgi:type I restriction enzyme, S subunit
MFGDPAVNAKSWPEGKLKQLCSHVIDCPHSTPIYSATVTPYLCVRSSDIQNGFFNWSTTKYVSLEEYTQRIVRLQPAAGDIVYCREGARFGNAAIIPKGKNVCLGQRTMLFRANPKVAAPAFIWGFLEAESTYREAERLTGGSASPHLNVGEIRNFTVPIPPLTLQEQYDYIVRRFERLRAQQLEAARQAEHLFQTLLHKAFRGELIEQEVKNAVVVGQH